ncbi:MAG: SDR family NAD(P)-dependent oxidoreductase [Candidatus Omnitrophica bacterium]|nr:SDR family NAD(P)-dependent oxidoreductase [Candidatus Omnitrophota bacterium]
MNAKKKILITGGAGFIGSHLAEALLAQGCRVSVIDDLSTGTRDNIAHLMENPDFHFTRDTIMDEMVMRKLVDSCDEIYHLAAAVGVKYILEKPLQSIHTNVQGTEIVLDLASKGNKKVLVASTSEVYGKNPSSVFPENADSILGSTKTSRWSYACAKALDEFLALAYCRKTGLAAVIVRFFNTVGPRQTGRYGMVIPRFISQALHNLPITVYGDGKQTRSFTYVGDVVKGIIDLMATREAVGDVCNIGNPQGITIEDLAKKIKEMTKSSSELVYVPYSQAYGEGFEDMRYRVPDVTKIHALTGYAPKVSLDEILERTIESMKDKRSEAG